MRSSSNGEEAPRSFEEDGVDVGLSGHKMPLSASASFFIIQEPNSGIISPNGGTRSGRSSTSGAKKNKSGRKSPVSTPMSPLSSSASTLRRKTASAQQRASSSGISSIVYEGHEDEEATAEAEIDGDSAQGQGNSDPTTTSKSTRELSVLSRCGSAPDLPLNSPLSASVYSSSKKRTLQISADGASGHPATLQRSRLTPLPINIRTGTMKHESMPKRGGDVNEARDLRAPLDEADTLRLSPKDPVLQERLRSDAHTIATLKQRLVILEREIAVSNKHRHASGKQVAQLSHDNQRLQVDTTQLQMRVDELGKVVLKQRHEYDKLGARYAAVYANLQRLADQRQLAATSSAPQTVLQALTRENQDFLRKLRVLEARHAEDKTLISNQEKKIKRLRAEMETLQHMNAAKLREEEEAPSDQNGSTAKDYVSHLRRHPDSENSSHGIPPSSASSSPSSPPSAARSPVKSGSSARTLLTSQGSNHLVSAEAYQYIDPSILKVLEKVDAQFSITNAINLSVALKKWLNSCVHVVCSTHLPTVLQSLLKRVCELLHCEHAALFTVDHAARKLRATCSESGEENWELPLDKGIAGYAARHNALCNVRRAYDDPRFYSSSDSITGSSSREVLCLPIAHDLQLQLNAHFSGGGDGSGRNVESLGVFAMLQVWNTTHQKPFTANDQILGGLLAIQAGIVLRQTARQVTKTLQKINQKMHQILQMPHEIVAKALSASRLSTMPSPIVEAGDNHKAPSSSTSVSAVVPGVLQSPSVVQLVAEAQKELTECLGIQQVRIFVLDTDVSKLWHVGECLPPPDAGESGRPTLVRRYVNAQASLCALLLHSDAKALVLREPSAEASFNDTVDIPGGARGLYLAPIVSLWGGRALPFGIVQVTRAAKARVSTSSFAPTTTEAGGDGILVGTAAAAAVNSEHEAAQQTEDRLMLELLELFCRVFAGLLHHVAAEQLYDACPAELQQAQLACLADRLQSLERDAPLAKQQPQQEEDTHTTANNASTTEPFVPPKLQRDTSSRHSSRRKSIAVVYETPPPSRSVRRIASAGSQLASTLAASPSINDAIPSGGVSVECESSYPHETDQREASDDWQSARTDAEELPDTDPALLDLQCIAASMPDSTDAAVDIETDAERLEPEPSQELKQDPWGQDHHEEETTEVSWPSPSPNAEDWTADANEYTPALDGEQFAGDAALGSTWEENGAYDTSGWPVDAPVLYDEAAAWEYGGGQVVPPTPEDGTDGNDRGGHLSTNSAYAIDLDTFRADPEEPNGAL
ncbi:hypothetical protein BBJ28_00004676 [Nothophytophthora sp. Chile5]|nr:hypothetical protein BBJ28_00004676 [Nothophytophthora sp. Chile5]